MVEIETFKEISFGGLAKSQLIGELVQRGVQFNEYARTLFEHPSFSVGAVVQRIKLAKVNLSDLGITQPCVFQGIASRASQLNLQLCPLALGAFLRLAYLDQPEGPYLTIASLRPEQDENYPNGFYVRNVDQSLWLRGYRATDDYEWPIESEFIFLKGDAAIQRRVE